MKTKKAPAEQEVKKIKEKIIKEILKKKTDMMMSGKLQEV